MISNCYIYFFLFNFRDDYQQLVFQALSFKMSNIKLLPPTILKPRPLWSGKQVLSTVIINVIPAGRPPINLTSTAKIGAKVCVISDRYIGFKYDYF